MNLDEYQEPLVDTSFASSIILRDPEPIIKEAALLIKRNTLHLYFTYMV